MIKLPVIFEKMASIQKLHDAMLPPGLRAALEMSKNFKSISETITTSNSTVLAIEQAARQSAIYNQVGLNESVLSALELTRSSPITKIIESSARYNIFLNKIGSYDSVAQNRFLYENFLVTAYDFEALLYENEEDEGREIIINETNRLKRMITDIYHENTTLLKISPREFEELIAQLLYAQGFKVELTKQTRDNGYDIIALSYSDKLNPLKFLVECKRYTQNKVDVDIIRSFNYVLAEAGANKGLIATTSYFTEVAKKEREKKPYLLEFKDKDQILEWVDDYWKNSINLNSFQQGSLII